MYFKIYYKVFKYINLFYKYNMAVQLQIPCPFRISPCIKYITQEYYDIQYDAYYNEYWIDNNYYKYTFVEWYFFYTRKLGLNHHKHLHAKLIIDSRDINNIIFL